MDQQHHQLHHTPSSVDQLRSSASTPISTFESPLVPATSLGPRPSSYQRSNNPRKLEKSPRRSSKQTPFDGIPESSITTPARNSSLRDSATRLNYSPATPQSRSSRKSYPSSSPRNSIPWNYSADSTPTRQTSSGSSRATFTRADDRSPLEKLQLELKHLGKEEGLIGTAGAAASGAGLSRSLSKKQTDRLQRSATLTSRVTSREYQLQSIFDPREERMASSTANIDTAGSGAGGIPIGSNPPVHPYLADKQTQQGDANQATFADRVHQEQLNGTQRENRGSQLIMGQSSSRASSVNSSLDEEQRNGSSKGVQPTSDGEGSHSQAQRKHHGLHLHRHKDPEEPHSAPRPEMFHDGRAKAGPAGGIVRLTLADCDVAEDTSTSGTDAPYPTSFNPPLTVKCGPLLRYLGLRQEKEKGMRLGDADQIIEIWRGSIMIVTTDSSSTYSPAPTLRLFAQDAPLDTDLGNFEIPATEAATMTAAGEPVVVMPTTEIPHQKDLSHGAGLGELTKPMEKLNMNTSRSKGRSKRDGERSKKFKEVTAQKIHAEHGYAFWRFNLEVELGNTQQRIAYRINCGPAIGFYVPAQDETMNIMFHSCNGFSLAVNPDDFNGPDPLWRDVLRGHAERPYHVMLGGGDQLYNDCVTEQAHLFKEWLATHNPSHKYKAPFTGEMRQELEMFYLERYAMWFAQGLFGVANSQIPMINIWDDHDIIDGFGSYPESFNGCPVFSGLGGIAFKYYMLFQHQTSIDEGENQEPSWLLGAKSGPYIHEQSRSNFMFLGRRVAFLGLDCRTERTRELLLTDETYTRVFARLESEIIKGQTKHLIVLLGVPIAYPRLVWLENILTSSLMNPLKFVASIGHGTLGGFMNKFDGSVELLDDMMDHWTARGHKQERNWLLKEMQELAAQKGCRVTFLGGDVHLATFGQFRSKPSLKVPKQLDSRYMLNVVSSAIVNTPPPQALADLLNKRNKIHKLAGTTYEQQVKIFFTDPAGKKRNNNSTLPARNYCNIYENIHGRTLSSHRDVTEPEVVKGDENIDIRGGLDCVINCEIDQKDPSGKTKAYGVTVPTLELSGKEKVRGGNESTSSIGRNSQSNASRSTA